MLHCCLPLFYLSCIPERNENVKRSSRWSVRGHQCCEVGRTDLISYLIEPFVFFVRSHQSGGLSLKGLHRLLDPPIAPRSSCWERPLLQDIPAASSR